MEEEHFRKSVACLNSIMKNIKEMLMDIKAGSVQMERLNNIKDDVKTIYNLTKDSKKH